MAFHVRVRVAAYNRQGMGPFSAAAQLLVDSTSAAIFSHALDNPNGNGGGGGVSSPGLHLIHQEVWFVGLVSLVAVFLLAGFVGVVCLRRRWRKDEDGVERMVRLFGRGQGAESAAEKASLGHYNGKRRDKCFSAL